MPMEQKKRRRLSLSLARRKSRKLTQEDGAENGEHSSPASKKARPHSGAGIQLNSAKEGLNIIGNVSSPLRAQGCSGKKILEAGEKRIPGFLSANGGKTVASDNVSSSCIGSSPSLKLKGSKDAVSSASTEKNSIAHWLKYPRRERSVSCPICNCTVLLSKINEHLDSDCKLHIASVIEDVDVCRELPGQHAECESKCMYTGMHSSTCTCVRGTGCDQKFACKKNSVQSGKEQISGDEWKDSVPKQDISSGTSMDSSLLTIPTFSEQDHVSTCSSITAGCNQHQSSNQTVRNDTKQFLPEGSQDSSIISLKNATIDEYHSGNDNKCSGIIECCTCVDLKENENYGYTLKVNDIYDDPSVRTSLERSNKVVNSEQMDASESKDFNESASPEQPSDPYYLSNFKLVLDTVLSNEEDRTLFNDEDNEVFQMFNELSPEAKKLYIRLFQRKFGWFRCSKLDYAKISNDLGPILKSLVEVGFLHDERHLTDLRETLKLLSAPDLKHLVKSLHVTSKSSSQKGQTKEHLIEALIRHGGTQRSLFGSSSTLLLKRARQLLGYCVHVSREPRSVFARALLLFSMNVIPDDEDNQSYGQTQQLSTLYLVNIGKVAYPSYTISREITVFHSREHLIKFAAAYQEKHEMFTALEVTGDLETAYSYYPKAAECFRQILAALKRQTSSQESELFSSSLLVHLRCFTAEWVYIRMCYLGVEVLQKKRQYQDAVNQLELLLQQDVYCTDCRGRWWERLALNLHQHLKQPNKALEVIKQALQDTHVRFGHRLALVQRAKRILSSPSYLKQKNTEQCDIEDVYLVEPHPANSVTITGKRSAELGVFIAHEVNKSGEVVQDTMTYCSVEEYALSHYRRQGYDEGIHGETSTFCTLYGLFFWDIIFTDGIPDVFRVPFQNAPLDIHFDTFYEMRQDLIENRLNKIRIAPVETLMDMLEDSWKKREGQSCAGVSWDRFTSIDQAKQLVSCFGGKLLSRVFEYFAKDLRHRHSGMPDLVVWNSTTLDYRIVEVKGPGDRLSTKQQIWLRDLASLGATAEVCHVTAVGSKKLQAAH